MEKNKNSKEDIIFLKKVGMTIGITWLSVALFAACKCSHDKMSKNHEYTDGSGSVVHNSDVEEVLTLRKVK